LEWKKKEVAAKSLKTDHTEELEKEFKIMIQLQHPYIVRLYGKWENENGDMFLISEFVNNGDLLSLLRQQKALSKAEKVSLMLQITCGLKYLHSKNIIHRDLAARNILIDKEESKKMNAKLTDFGLSRQSAQKVYYGSENVALPLRWCAPESIQKKKFSEKSDIHSLAIVFYEIISNGQLPFSNLKNVEAIDFICEGGYPIKPDSADDDIYELSKSIVNLDPQQRPTLDEITSKLEKFQSETQTVFTNYYYRFSQGTSEYEKSPSTQYDGLNDLN